MAFAFFSKSFARFSQGRVLERRTSFDDQFSRSSHQELHPLDPAASLSKVGKSQDGASPLEAESRAELLA